MVHPEADLTEKCTYTMTMNERAYTDHFPRPNHQVAWSGHLWQGRRGLGQTKTDKVRHQDHSLSTQIPGGLAHRVEGPIHPEVQRRREHEPVHSPQGLFRLQEPHLHRHRSLRSERFRFLEVKSVRALPKLAHSKVCQAAVHQCGLPPRPQPDPYRSEAGKHPSREQQLPDFHVQPYCPVLLHFNEPTSTAS